MTVSDNNIRGITPQNRSKPTSQHPPDLAEIASIWPTASARDWKDGQASPETHDRNSRPLNEVATLWATPRSTGGEKGGPNTSFGAGGTPLPAQAAQFWATPNAQLGTGYMSGTNRDTWRPTLETQAQGYVPVLHEGRESRVTAPVPWISSPSSLPAPPISTDGGKSSIPILDSPRLNPRFVSWLMGWPPIGSDGSACSATEWSRWRLAMRSALCSLLSGKDRPGESRQHYLADPAAQEDSH